MWTFRGVYVFVVQSVMPCIRTVGVIASRAVLYSKSAAMIFLT